MSEFEKQKVELEEAEVVKNFYDHEDIDKVKIKKLRELESKEDLK